MSDQMLSGVEGFVKWFDPRKGFGFIVGPAGQDIFVHYSVIQGDGFRVLKDGSPVRYDAEQTAKGWRSTRAEAIARADGAGLVEVKPHGLNHTPHAVNPHVSQQVSQPPVANQPSGRTGDEGTHRDA